MAGETAYNEIIRTIAGSYEGFAHSIADQLLLQAPDHYPVESPYRENVWRSLLEVVVPPQYGIAQKVFLMDAFGHLSKETDLAVFDKAYTPYTAVCGELKFLPVEAVAAVVMCRGDMLNKKVIAGWKESVSRLVTSLDSVVRMPGYLADNMDTSEKGKVTQTATRPIKILCTLADESELWRYEKYFDIFLLVDREKKNLQKGIPKEAQSLEEWNDSLNHAIERIEDAAEREHRKKKKKAVEGKRMHLLEDLKVMQSAEEENVILSLILQLNQLFMVRNNPMLFPHRAYAAQFSSVLRDSD